MLDHRGARRRAAHSRDARHGDRRVGDPLEQLVEGRAPRRRRERRDVERSAGAGDRVERTAFLAPHPARRTTAVEAEIRRHRRRARRPARGSSSRRRSAAAATSDGIGCGTKNPAPDTRRAGPAPRARCAARRCLEEIEVGERGHGRRSRCRGTRGRTSPGTGGATSGTRRASRRARRSLGRAPQPCPERRSRRCSCACGSTITRSAGRRRAHEDSRRPLPRSPRRVAPRPR